MACANTSNPRVNQVPAIAKSSLSDVLIECPSRACSSIYIGDGVGYSMPHH